MDKHIPSEANAEPQALPTPIEENPMANQSLYHAESTRMGQLRHGSEIHSDYNRDLAGYLEELNRPGEVHGKRLFRMGDWMGKTVLDLGAGGQDRFGREARKWGIRVISLNPALRESRERNRLQEPDTYDELLSRPAIDMSSRGVLGMLRKTLFGRKSSIKSGIEAPQDDDQTPERIAALGQALPLADNSVDCVVSVFAVPHYLHHVNSDLETDAEITAAYTPEVRKQDKQLIGQALGEIVRVLKPGGKAYLKDTHRGAKQTRFISSFSPSDGTEVVEALDELSDVDVKVYERENMLILNPFTKEEIPSSTERTIVLTKAKKASSTQ